MKKHHEKENQKTIVAWCKQLNSMPVANIIAITNSCNGLRIFVTFYAKSRIKTAKHTTPLSKALWPLRAILIGFEF